MKDYTKELIKALEAMLTEEVDAHHNAIELILKIKKEELDNGFFL